jgi:hypothetical protein
MRFTDAKTRIDQKAAAVADDQKDVRVPISCVDCRSIIPRPANRYEQFSGVPVPGGYRCPECHATGHAKNYAPWHPKADRDGMVLVRDLIAGPAGGQR